MLRERERKLVRVKSRMERYRSELCLSSILSALHARGSRRLNSANSMSDLGTGQTAHLLRLPSQPEGMESPLFTPPGTPPPPYGDLSPSTVDVTPGSDVPAGLDLNQSNNSNHEPSMVDTSCTSPSAPSKVNQPFIMSIEDDDLSEQENYQDDHGPFNTLSNLLSDHAHLAVFMNYVISNCDSSSLFFYLISALYKEGNPKDMRRWAYEIHSCFLVPGAAMRVPSIDDVTVMKIDEVLLNDVDKVEKLRSVFQRARIKARDEINEQLADFRSKRSAGLGAMFGPRDHELEEARSDRVKEARIVEEVLVRLLETVYPSAELDNASEQTQSQASSLATVLYRHFNCRTPSVQQIVDSCPTFVSKERSFKYKILGRNKKPPGTRGHQFQLHQYYIITFCNVCGDSIRGISPQGYQCAHCEMSIHKLCFRTVEEQCVGANPKRGGDKISKLMERIRPEQRRRGTSAGVALNTSATSNDRSKRLSEDPTDTTVLDNDPGAAGDRLTGKDGKRGDQSTERDRKNDEPSGDGDSKSPSRGQRQQNKSSISRSESCRDERERHHNRRYPREKRKHSDPSIPASKASDAELEADPLGNSTHSGSSSNSSLSARLESPSTSMDSVSVSRLGGLFCEGSPGWDSDMEIDADPPDWKSQVPPDVLRTLRPSEKKRLDVVNELFHTERTHVRNLKILVHAFYRPMLNLNILQANDLNLLFGNVEELLEIHSRFSDAMKRRQRESPMLDTVGDVLVNIFEGESGENFKTASAAFCRCQSISLEKLRWLQKRDQRLSAFLIEAESDPVCRRLQLKDILPTGMQRLTKYPLLLSSLVKHTARGTDDHRLVQRACDSSKKILEHVNKVKGETERHERLVEIQSKLDQHAFTRADNPTVVEFNGRLDLTKYRMVHEGSVQFKFSNKSKHAELHMLLLERFIVLLQRQDDKYALKFHTINGREMSPIIKTDNILVRPMATEKRAFFILHNLSVGPHIYELLFGSSNERDTWYRLIKDAADSCQSRDGSSGHGGGGGGKGHKRTESAHSVLSHSTSQPLRSSSPAAADDAAAAAAGGGGRSTPGRGGSTSTPCTPTVANSPPSAAQQTTPVSTKSPSGSVDGAGAATAGSPKPARRMQRVEMLKITESTQLIDPTEIVVSQGVVLSADAVLTPLERLRRKDEQVRRALSEKQQLVADLLHIPRQDYRHVAELADEAAAAAPHMAASTAAAAEPRELLLSAVHNVDRSLSVLNQALNATEADLVAAGGGPTSPAAAPTPQQTTAAAPEMDQLVVLNGRLSATLSALLGAISERDVERERMRRELRVSHERIHQLERRLGGGPAAVDATSAGGESPHSRPVSYVSVASSLELTEEPEEEEEEQREESSSEEDDGEDMRSLSDVTPEVTTDGKTQHQDSDESTVNDPTAPTTDQNESSATQSETTVTSTQEDAT